MGNRVQKQRGRGFGTSCAESGPQVSNSPRLQCGFRKTVVFMALTLVTWSGRVRGVSGQRICLVRMRILPNPPCRMYQLLEVSFSTTRAVETNPFAGPFPVRRRSSPGDTDVYNLAFAVSVTSKKDIARSCSRIFGYRIGIERDTVTGVA